MKKPRKPKPVATDSLESEFKNLTMIKGQLAWDSMVQMSAEHHIPVDQLFFMLSNASQHCILDSLNEDLKHPVVTVKKITTE